jgi:hypothetical protein
MSTETSTNTENSNYRLPDADTLRSCSKLAIVEDKPIMMDYWVSSLNKESSLGLKPSGEKILVKNAEEYTSPIQNVYKSGNDFIIETENSLYIVDKEIKMYRADIE